ncbi:MAG: acyl-ACP desaturase [Planctomycetes bacterium]|nr:acyl-ACP desaturase [Planctomycetota bacterium]
MEDSLPKELETALWRLFRDFFRKAEKKRRWSLDEDIPWDQCNRNLDPAIADIVESFCAVELFLPDYIPKFLGLNRTSRGRAWFLANWGYEELKHSMALGDWLLRSGQRSDEQMFDLERQVQAREWHLPMDSGTGMIVYAMTQELATWLNYRNLRRRVQEKGGDPALEQLLMFIAVDERAHHSFFLECVQLFLQYDRKATLDQMRRVMDHFNMPAIYELADSRLRVARIKELEVFTETLYFEDVYRPILSALDVSRAEMRNRPAGSKLPAKDVHPRSADVFLG